MAASRQDGDKQPLEAFGKRCKRDIVQFVPFRNFAKRHISELAAETLAEIPAQITGFMKLHQVRPMIRRADSILPPAFAQYAVSLPALCCDNLWLLAVSRKATSKLRVCSCRRSSRCSSK